MLFDILLDALDKKFVIYKKDMDTLFGKSINVIVGDDLSYKVNFIVMYKLDLTAITIDFFKNRHKTYIGKFRIVYNKDLRCLYRWIFGL